MKLKQYLFTQGLAFSLMASTALTAAPMQHQPAVTDMHHADECHHATHKHSHHHKQHKHGHHQASACPLPMKNAYTGFFVGGQIGYAYTITNYPCTGLTTGIGSFDRHNTRGWIGGFHGGYGYQFCNCWYLGLDLTADFLTNKEKLLSNGTTDVYWHKIKNSFGVNPRVGYVFQGRGLMYVKVGAQFTRWIHGIDRNGLGVGAKKSKRLPGFAPGLGFSYLMCDNFILGLEGTYVKYYKEPEIKNLANTDHGFHDHMADLQLRLSYRF